MNRQELAKKLIHEAHNKAWVVISDNGHIWGSNAGYDTIRMAGGAIWIFNAGELRGLLKHDCFFGIGNIIYHDPNEVLDIILNKLKEIEALN